MMRHFLNLANLKIVVLGLVCAISAINIVLTFTFRNDLRKRIERHDPDYTASHVNTVLNAAIAFGYIHTDPRVHANLVGWFCLILFGAFFITAIRRLIIRRGCGARMWSDAEAYLQLRCGTCERELFFLRTSLSLRRRFLICE